MVDFREFQDLDLQILGIAVQTSFSQKTFADSLGLPFPLLSDHPDARVTRLYAAGSFIPGGTDLTPFLVPGRSSLRAKKDRILADQAFFLVDKEGILRGRWLPGNEEAISSKHILNMARAIAGKP